MSAGPKHPHSSAKRTQHLQSQAAEELFERAEDMAEAIESLVLFLNQRYRKRNDSSASAVLGFVIEGLKVQFSAHVEQIEVVTHFAESSATVLVPSQHFPDPQLQDQQRQELLRFFFPALKDAQLRATLQLYKTLRFEARRNLIDRFGMAGVTAATEGMVDAMAGRHPLVLIVDDNENIREAIVAMLEHENIVAATAVDGRDAFHYIKTSPSPSLIILDWDMPLMNGRQFMEARAADPTVEKIPVLIYSGRILNGADYEHFANCQYLEKQTDIRTLLDFIHRVLALTSAGQS